MLASIRNSSRLLRCASSFKAASTVSTRSFHSSGVLSAEEKGPIEKELDQKTLDFQAFLARNVDAAGLDGDHVPLKVSQLADAIVGLSMVEAMQLGEALKKRLGITDSMLMGSISGLSVAAAPAEAAGGAAAAEPAKAEKSTVDIRLKAYKAEVKVKVIKEIRAITSLGLKEAKELVESAPCTVLEKVKREEAEKLIEKLKAETGAEVELV